MNALQLRILAGCALAVLAGSAMALDAPAGSSVNPARPGATRQALENAGQQHAEVKLAPVNLPAVDTDTLLARNLQARGGEANWKLVGSLRFAGKMDAGRARPNPDNSYANPSANAKERRKERILREREIDVAPVVQLPYQLDVGRGRKSHLELTFNDQVAVQTYDGQHGWKLMPFLGGEHVDHATAYSAEELRLASDQSDLDGWLMEAHRQHFKVEQLAPELVEGKPAYHLRLTLPNGDQRGVWLDAETSLEVKIEGARRFNGQTRPMYTYLSDYRKVDGIVLPFLQETRMDGFKDGQKLAVESVQVNPQLPSGHFGKPVTVAERQ